MKKPGLLLWIVIAIVMGLALGSVLPEGVVRAFLTFNGIFSSFLGFCIPLIILGLIAPGIADLGKGAKRLLVITVLIAWSSTVLTGYFTYFTTSAIFPSLVEYSPAFGNVDNPESGMLSGFFTIPIPPLLGVTTSLILAFTLGLGMAAFKSDALTAVFKEFRTIMEFVITKAIIPLLPIYIFGIFMNMKRSGDAFELMAIFGKIIIVIFVLHILVLVVLFVIAGVMSKQNPFKLMWNMLPAYMTALGTSSSAATIPVTLAQTKKNSVTPEIADFTVPLCATIHMTGSTTKIVAMSLAVCIMQGLPHNFALYTGFILMLSISMVAAPGVPGGAIMVAVGVLQSILGFDATAVGLMIALYIAIDSFGTAGNVTGDGAISIMVDEIEKKRKLKLGSS
jgi:Na+/H+-dicarboxylate symporter